MKAAAQTEDGMIVYKITTEKGRHKRRGIQVGRFAVRATTKIDTLLGVPLRPFAVDHVPSGCLVIDADTQADAMVLADDLSRFSRKDPSSPDPDKAAEQIGPVLKWALAAKPGVHVVAYRQSAEAAS